MYCTQSYLGVGESNILCINREFDALYCTQPYLGDSECNIL